MKTNAELESKKEKLEYEIIEDERSLEFANWKNKEQINNYIEEIQRKINFINYRLKGF